MYGIRFQPFWLSGGTYGYQSPDPEDEEKTIESSKVGLYSFLSMLTAAAAVDVPGALAIIPLGFLTNGFLDEENWWRFAYGKDLLYHPQAHHDPNMTWPQRIKALFKYRDTSHGISGVVSIMAGYLAASWIFDKDARKLWLPLVGAGGTLLQHIKTLMTEVKGLEHVNHFAHFGGMVYGFVFGWLIKRYWRKKTRGVGFLRRNDVPITLAITAGFVAFMFIFTAGGEREKALIAQQIAERQELGLVDF